MVDMEMVVRPQGMHNALPNKVLAQKFVLGASTGHRSTGSTCQSGSSSARRTLSVDNGAANNLLATPAGGKADATCSSVRESAVPAFSPSYATLFFASSSARATGSSSEGLVCKVAAEEAR